MRGAVGVGLGALALFGVSALLALLLALVSPLARERRLRRRLRAAYREARAADTGRRVARAALPIVRPPA